MLRHSSDLTGARWFAIASVVALSIVVVALAALAFQRSRTEGVATPNPIPSFTLGVPKPTPTPTSATPFVGPQASRDSQRFLDTEGEVWWRGVAGECGVSEPTIERSIDDGATWADVTPRYLAIGELLSLDAFTTTDAEIVAKVGESCQLEALRTYTQGEFWEAYPDVLSNSRFIDASVPATVFLGANPQAAPCSTPRGMSTSGDALALVCDRAAWVWQVDNWVAVGIPEAQAVAVAGNSVLVAHSSPECEGVALTQLDVNDLTAAVTADCAPHGATDEPVAVSFASGPPTLWIGSSIIRAGE